MTTILLARNHKSNLKSEFKNEYFLSHKFNSSVLSWISITPDFYLKYGIRIYNRKIPVPAD